MSHSLHASLQFFKDIAALKSTTKKLEALATANEVDKQVLVCALDPYRMYGVKKLPTSRGSLPDSGWSMFALLDALAARQVTGGRAKAACLGAIAGGAPEELLLMILNKDLRCGLAATSVNKVFPDLIREFKVALAKEYEDDGIWPKYESEKYDGLRGLAFVTEDGVTFKTRNGLEITSVEHLHLPLFRAAWQMNLVFDGEIKLKTGHFQDSSGAARKKSENNPDLAFYIFDWLPIEEFLAQSGTYTQRERIEKLDEWALTVEGNDLIIVPHSLVYNDTEAQRKYEAVLARKGEGEILKNPDSLYQFKRSSAWVKMKDVQSVDVRVKGLVPGKGKYLGKVGALMIDFNGQDNAVGSGISDADRQLWQDNPDLILGKMVEVNYHELTKDGNLRHSRFNKIRWDKE